MTDKLPLTSSHIKYLLVLKKLSRYDGIRSVEIANELNLSRASVHNMMKTFIMLDYIKKERGGQIFLTQHGLDSAAQFEKYYCNIKARLFADAEFDESADNAVFAFLAELSAESLAAFA